MKTDNYSPESRLGDLNRASQRNIGSKDVSRHPNACDKSKMARIKRHCDKVTCSTMKEMRVKYVEGRQVWAAIWLRIDAWQNLKKEIVNYNKCTCFSNSEWSWTEIVAPNLSCWWITRGQDHCGVCKSKDSSRGLEDERTECYEGLGCVVLVVRCHVFNLNYCNDCSALHLRTRCGFREWCGIYSQITHKAITKLSEYSCVWKKVGGMIIIN